MEEFLKLGANCFDSKFDLRSEISIDVKDQGLTEACWAFSSLSSMETNLKLTYGRSPDFSEQHMNYATSASSFYDGSNKNGFNRRVSDGGSTIIAMAYLTNGQGAVLEDDMPFQNNMNDISLNDIQKDPKYYVKGYEILPSIYKIKSNNDILYTDGVSKIYTLEEVKAIRNQIKEHIVKYGGIIAYTASTEFDCYNSSNVLDASAYFCDDINTKINHAITIVGWDDDYSKENFTGKYKPNENGAYLVLNTYSENSFDNGYLWISYEDVWIESELYGITDSAKIEYEEMYQNDWYGANIPITLTSDNSNVKQVYYASVYDREQKDSIELLTEISVVTNQAAKFEVFVNPNSEDLSNGNLTKVATTEKLNAGYNTIPISPTVLNGDKFAVLVKQTSFNDDCYFMIEAQIDNTFYSNAEAQLGYSKVSLDGTRWYNLADLGHLDYGGLDIDLSKADICIKAFTTLNNITSSEYAISQDGYITKIYDETKIEDFLKKFDFSDEKIELITSDGRKVENNSELVKTGMIMKVNGISYTLVVRGDLSGDGKISLIDLSKQIAHYTGIEGFVLTGAYDKASDMNLDGEISIIDISQLLVLYTNM